MPSQRKLVLSLPILKAQWIERQCFLQCGLRIPQGAAVDDVDFVRRMITNLSAEHPINSQQIFATGMSMAAK